MYAMLHVKTVKNCFLSQSSAWKKCFITSYNQGANLQVTYEKKLPLVQVKERDRFVQICALSSCLHVQFTHTPTILDVSLLSSFIHFTDTTNLNNCIELQRHLCFIYSLNKEFESSWNVSSNHYNIALI